MSATVDPAAKQMARFVVMFDTPFRGMILQFDEV
jgi:hypothetical protein